MIDKESLDEWLTCMFVGVGVASIVTEIRFRGYTVPGDLPATLLTGVGIGLALGLLVQFWPAIQRRLGLAPPLGPPTASWLEVAEQIGLECAPALMFQPWQLRGRLGRAMVTVSMRGRRGRRDETTHHLSPDGLPASVTITQRSGRGWASAANQVLTGDEAFDEVVGVHGPEDALLALLDSGLRRRLRELLQQGAEVRAGALTFAHPTIVVVTEQVLAQERGLEAVIRHLSGVADALALDPAQVGPRLARNAAEDSVAAVRWRNLAVLQAAPAWAAIAADASRRALSDAELTVRLQGVAGLAPGDLDITTALARDRAAPEELRAAALQHLARHGARETLIALFLELAPARDPDLVQAPLCLALASLAARLADARTEPALIALLEHTDSAVRQAAASSLGVVGSRDAVEPMGALLRRPDGTRPLRSAADAALEKIRSRLVDARPGALAIAGNEGPEGGLSVALDPAGLSLAVPAPEADTETDRERSRPPSTGSAERGTG